MVYSGVLVSTYGHRDGVLQCGSIKMSSLMDDLYPSGATSRTQFFMIMTIFH